MTPQHLERINFGNSAFSLIMAVVSYLSGFGVLSKFWACLSAATLILGVLIYWARRKIPN